ncbi:MAG: hypothetical protein GX540_06105 [Clostridiales bacterium]|nr:hypothetical protein [Clostridiales bacterium]
MKCPACGYWNRASYPHCFRCGEPLKAIDRMAATLPAEELQKTAPLPEEVPTEIRYDEEGNERVAADRKDRLAIEMLSLHERKKRGEQKQKQLRERGAERGFAPTQGQLTYSSRRSRLFSSPEAARQRRAALEDTAVGIDYDGYVETPTYQSISEDFTAYSQSVARNRPGGGIPLPKAGRKRGGYVGRRRAVFVVALLLLLAAGGIVLNQFVIGPWLVSRAVEEPEAEQVQISASILDDMAAHTIAIPAPEGAQIYIKELRKSYIATGGYATVQVADYIWYELEERLIQPTMDVTLTPYIRTSSGEQKQMDLVHYTIEIPLSPIALINPDVTYLEVSTPIYNIRFHVMQNSKVYINGEDYSSYVNTQSGYISYNAAIQPIGDNSINIVVRSQYYRENEVTIVIHRAVQDIPLDLASTLDDESSNPTMKISATTRAGATVTVLSPHRYLDTSLLGSTGAFTFEAVFSKIGINTVEIRADFPDKKPTVVKYDIYYLPPPDSYTKKAWALDDWGYPDLLANISTRVANTQIYVFTGPVKEIISTKPQLVLIDASDGKGAQRMVMVENQTKTEWVLGERYELYGDAYGMYGSLPRLIARYTYKPKN